MGPSRQKRGSQSPVRQRHVRLRERAADELFDEADADDRLAFHEEKVAEAVEAAKSPNTQAEKVVEAPRSPKPEATAVLHSKTGHYGDGDQASIKKGEICPPKPVVLFNPATIPGGGTGSWDFRKSAVVVSK